MSNTLLIAVPWWVMMEGTNRTLVSSTSLGIIFYCSRSELRSSSLHVARMEVRELPEMSSIINLQILPCWPVEFAVYSETAFQELFPLELQHLWTIGFSARSLMSQSSLATGSWPRTITVEGYGADILLRCAMLQKYRFLRTASFNYVFLLSTASMSECIENIAVFKWIIPTRFKWPGTTYGLQGNILHMHGLIWKVLRDSKTTRNLRISNQGTCLSRQCI